MRKFVFACALGMVLAANQAPASAASDNVDRAFVEGAIARGAILWDVRDERAYAKGHIPGAVNVGSAGDVLREPNGEDFLPIPTIERVLGAGGIDPAKEIVVYATTGNPYAHFAQYTIRFFGGRKVHVYHGGIDDWRAAGKPVSTTPAAPTPVKLSLKPDTRETVQTADVLKAVGEKGVQIVDARTPGEYSGADIRALRGGHVPGAINIPYEQNWKDPETPKKLRNKSVKTVEGMNLKDAAALKALYAKLDPEKETIVYCQSGARASQTAAVMRDIGFKNVKVYDSSWLGYGNTFSAPVENATYFNVGKLNGRLAQMQARIEQLEKELADARKAKQ